MHQRSGTARFERKRGRAAVVAVAALAFAALAVGCGEEGGSGSTPTTTPPSTSAQPATTVERGAPRWETVTTLKGTGPAEPAPFTILKDSIQWRARWGCESGALRITTTPAPRRPAPLVDAACPGRGEGFAIVTGDVRLTIEATGPWEVIVDQQIDTPLREPPPEGMAAAPVLRQGTFHPIEKEARGRARIATLPDGRNVLRFEDFEVSTNVDLFVWISEAPDPRTSAESVAAPYVELGNLRSTVGDQNYFLPGDLPPERMRSVVIWCAPIRIAYGAAPLT